MTEHECLAKPIYDVADELMQLCSRMEELERIESTNRALGIRLHEVELERDRYFQQKQENGKIVGDLKTELRALRKLLPDVDCAS